MTVLHIDLETRSVIDLTKTGAYVYAAHPTTDVWCAAYAFDDEPIELWVPGDPVPDRIVEHVLMGGIVYAHNAAFERTLWRYVLAPRYHWPEPDVTQWRCTMVQAYAMGLPGSLEMAAPAAGLDVSKDMGGRRLMLQMAKPRGKIAFETGFTDIPQGSVAVGQPDADGWQQFELNGRPVAKVRWWNDAEKRQRLNAYCVQDVEVERQLEKRLKPMKKSELALWHLDQVINDRGVLVDMELAHAAKKIVEQAEDVLDKRMSRATNFNVTACSNRNQILAYLQDLGLDIDSIKKDILDELLDSDIVEQLRKTDAEAAQSKDPVVIEARLNRTLSVEERAKRIREVLTLRREAAKASVAKIDALERGASPEDGRAKGMLQFHAASTGRWGGRRFQPQNLRRPEESDIDNLITVVATGDYEYVDMAFGEPLSAVADILRGLIIAAPGHRIIAADYSNIEGRVLAWLAGEQWKVDAFRDFDAGRGHDLYALAYARSYGITPEEVMHNKKHGDGSMRQIGKVMELALGYQGGVGAFVTMGANYGVDLPREKIEEIRDAWRSAHPNIKQFWYDTEQAAVAAVEEPGVTTSAGKILFKMTGSFLGMRLPSKRWLFYPYPKVVEFEMPWTDRDGNPVKKNGLSYMSTLDVSKKAKVIDDPANTSSWGRIKTYGGMLVENATQAAARDILAHAMPRLEAAGYPIILTVHDEIVCEVPDGHGSVEEMEAIMCDLPAWADGLPVAAEGFEDRRYRK